MLSYNLYYTFIFISNNVSLLEIDAFINLLNEIIRKILSISNPIGLASISNFIDTLIKYVLISIPFSGILRHESALSNCRKNSDRYFDYQSGNCKRSGNVC